MDAPADVTIAAIRPVHLPSPSSRSESTPRVPWRGCCARARVAPTEHAPPAWPGDGWAVARRSQSARRASSRRTCCSCTPIGHWGCEPFPASRRTRGRRRCARSWRGGRACAHLANPWAVQGLASAHVSRCAPKARHWNRLRQVDGERQVSSLRVTRDPFAAGADDGHGRREVAAAEVRCRDVSDKLGCHVVDGLHRTWSGVGIRGARTDRSFRAGRAVVGGRAAFGPSRWPSGRAGGATRGAR